MATFAKCLAAVPTLWLCDPTSRNFSVSFPSYLFSQFFLKSTLTYIFVFVIIELIPTSVRAEISLFVLIIVP